MRIKYEYNSRTLTLSRSSLGTGPMATNTQIIEFYSGRKPDHRGRYLSEIQLWTDDQLEVVHDYIQWLFPLAERSGFNVAAPVLNREVIEAFRTRLDLQRNLRASFLRMIGFYGLEVCPAEPITVTRGLSFPVRSAGWLTPGNHNHLRITRILGCLSVLGLDAEVKAFFEFLAEIYEEEQEKPLPAISDETFDYWGKAARKVLRGT